jgi:HEAT repeat protein
MNPKIELKYVGVLGVFAVSSPFVRMKARFFEGRKPRRHGEHEEKINYNFVYCVTPWLIYTGDYIMTKIIRIILVFAFFTPWLHAADKLSTEELIQNLKSPDAQTRMKAADELGDRGEKLGVEALVSATTDNDPKVQLEVVKALGKINHPGQVSSLSTAVRNTSGKAQLEAIHLLTELYIPSQDRGSLQELWDSMVNLFNPPHPTVVEPWIRVDDEATDAILFVLDQKNSENRIEAAATLGILRAHRSLPRLVYYLKSPNEKMVRTCIRSIGYIRDPESGADLVPLLKHSNEEIVVDAVRVLGQFRYTPALPELQQFLDYTNKDEYRRVALQAIGRIADPSSEKVFVKYLDSDDKYMRQYAIEGLGRMGNQKYVQTLQREYQREKSDHIKLALCFSLFSLGESAYVDSLIRFLDKNIYKEQVREYLYELGPKAVPHVAAYLKASDKSYKLRLIRVLGDMRQPSAIEFLQPYLKDQDVEVAQAATDAVRQLKKVQTS